MLFVSRLPLLLAAAVLVGGTSAEKGKRRKAIMSVEKGVKCKGCGDKTKNGKKCKGGLKMEFSMGSDATDIMEEIAEGVRGHLGTSFFPDTDDLTPDDDMMEQMMLALQDGDGAVEALDSDGNMDMSKTFEFGGMAKVEWGCKVTYAREKGKFSKTVECGFKGEKGMGKKPKGILFDSEEDVAVSSV